MLFIFLAVFLMLCLVFGGILLVEVARIRELLELSKPKSESKKIAGKK